MPIGYLPFAGPRSPSRLVRSACWFACCLLRLSTAAACCEQRVLYAAKTLVNAIPDLHQLQRFAEVPRKRGVRADSQRENAIRTRVRAAVGLPASSSAGSKRCLLRHARAAAPNPSL